MAKESSNKDSANTRQFKNVDNVFCECRDRNNNSKVHKTISLRFVLAVEFTCVGCKNMVTVKVESPTQKVLCPVCGNCEFTITDTFNKLLATAKRPTPHRRSSRRDADDRRKDRIGRPTLDGVRREHIQFSLHPDTLDALYELNVNRGALIEFLLNLFPPFVSILENKKGSGQPDTLSPT